MSFSAIIVDDEPLAIEALRRFCQRSDRVAILGDAANGTTGLNLVDALHPDVVFLDIGMPELNGLEVATRIPLLTHQPLIVFVTALDNYAAQAFDLSVADYILKPLEPSRFDRAIQRIERLLPVVDEDHLPTDEFWVPSRGSMVRISSAAIDRVDAERDYVRLSTDERSYLLRESMAAIAARLDRDLFVRIHRSAVLRIATIVALRHLGAGAWAAVDHAGRVSRIGRSYLAKVREQLGYRAKRPPST